ncbi:MAG: hypothetical protein VX366_01370 [Candidatus Thermoplasmatota archaeon]|nr:hypothetical protein [Candidatus Thermoplasmatota archaeon]
MEIKRGIAYLLVLLFASNLLALTSANSPSSIEIDSHAQSITADEAVQLHAIVKDSSGNEIDSPVTWSASSGSIDASGLFIPGNIGVANITASSGQVNQTTSITVTNGRPAGIESYFNNTEISIDDTILLHASLVDRAGNQVSGDLTYRCQNGNIDYANQTWSPDNVGNTTMRIIYLELETQVVFNVQPGQPVTLEIPFGITVQSGTTQHIMPIAKDAAGNEVGISKAGTLSWEVENGSISPTGVYFAGAPGTWNVSVNSTSGASGKGIIHVLPAQSTGLSIEVNSSQARTGSPVKLTAIRSDVLGNTGEILLPISNWTVPTGSLSLSDNSVIWTPTKTGDWTIGVSDAGYSATLQVNVIQGEIIGIDISLSESVIRSSDLIVASISAYDSAGNGRAVNGAWTIDSELNAEDKGGWMQIKPGPIGTYSLSATWFDNETQTVHQTESTVSVVAGELSRIILPESGTQVASDSVLYLNPIFEDEYGNTIQSTQVTWIVDNEDRTMQIRLAGEKWAPSSLGIHEIRAMADGVFAITNIEVIAGTARQISTNVNQGVSVDSGESAEIIISTLDVHGNSALADNVEFEFDDPKGSVSPSPKGGGFWQIEGGETGTWNLRIKSGTASLDIIVNVSHGEPVRLLVELPEQNPEEGSKMIARIHAIDQAGNRVEVPSSEITIKCTVGEVTHLSGDTYEVSVDESGQSQSCNFYWDDLVAQKFFDVNAVLFGGGLGNSNAALTMVSVIILLFIAIMVVLVRRMKKPEYDDEYWEDDVESDEDEGPQTSEQIMYTSETTRTPEPEPEPVKEEKRDIRAELAQKAQETGVMQAAPGTEQGKTGWYVDSTGELTSWIVGEDGSWTRMS